MIMGNLRFQQEYFRIYKNNTESTTHRNAYWVKLAKNVEATKMMYALSTIVQQHASIRHFFDVTTDDNLTMILHEFLPFIEIKQVPTSSANYDLEAFFKQELSTYHFNDSPLFKFKLFQFADAAYILLDFHVSIFDDSQIDIFLDDLCNAYRGNTVINNTRQHAHLNRNDDKHNQDASHIALDSNYFRLENNSDIHIDSYLPIKHPFEQALYQTYLIDDMTSIDMASLAVSVYLANHIMSQQHDVTLGIHVPSHLPNDLHGNIVPLTLTIDAKDVCQRFTTDFNKCVLQNMSQLQCANSSLSLETIFHCYHHMMSCCNDVIEDVHQIHDAHTSLADIEIFPHQHGFKIIYNSAAYDLLSIETLSDLVRNIYLQITEENGNKRTTVDELNLMTERDIQLYDDINVSLPEIDDAQTVVTLFEQQVEATPNHVAVQFDGVFITYQTLNARANDLAHRLRNQYGVEPNDRVAVIAEKSIEMIIAMIGVLKAGGAYVPIDPNYPSDRQEYILKDATPKVVITYQALYENGKQNINHIDLNKIAWKNIDNLSKCNTLEDHAYVIYTSGTTGNPKGTLIPHRGIVRLVHQNHYVPLNEETTILLSGTIAFDAATFEIYGALLNGGKLIVAKKEQLLNPIALEQLINENDVNTMWLTSSLFNQIASERIEVLVPLKYLLIGGEVLNAKWVDLLNQKPKHPQIINGYGPTENTTFTTTYNIPNKVPNRIPIGKPILGTHVYIMQGECRCGVGIPGELCTSGFGLAAGYLNQPELTADKFIKDSNINQLMYRSGDIVRLLPDGNIDYLYRKDKQVKIRGFRIELSEVEHALERIQGINKAVVIVQNHDLVAPFNLEKPSQIRVRYIRSPLHAYLFIDTHHIINDGMSNIQLMNDLNALYQHKLLLPLKLQYKDYSEWMSHRDMTKHRQYWLSQFKDEVPILSLPTDYVRPNIKTTNGAMMSFTMNQQMRQLLQKYVEKHQITDFMFFMSVVMTLLSRYARKDDVVVGSVMSARMHKGTEQMLGMFANTLVYRGQPSPDKMWTQFLQEVKEMSLEAYEHQEYPFECLVNDLDQSHDASRNPLFDVMLVLQNNETNHAHFGHSKLTHIQPKSVTAKFDLSFIIEEDRDDYIINIEYNTDLYHSETVRHMGNQCMIMIDYILKHQDTLQICDIPNGTEELLNWVNTHVNDRMLNVPGNKSIISYFNEAVSRQGNHVALVMNDLTMTYETLHNYVDAIAHMLLSNGVGNGQRVALFTERSFEMIAAMLATVKVGASYIPIDIDFPNKRQGAILEDAKVTAVMSYGVEIETTLPVIQLENAKGFVESKENEQYDDLHGNQLENTAMLDNEMYAIYTSGTTGMPKGVAIRQRNLLNLVHAWSTELQLGNNEVFLQHANIVFDASVMEIYCCLLNGHTLVIPDREERVNPAQLQQLINKHRVTVASIPLQMCSVMEDFYIEKLITGGATSTASFVKYIEKHCGTYFNAYGPSESTVITSYWSHHCGDLIPETIPIGKPLSNIQVYIMSDGLLCGIGMPGELCIAGDSLAIGYINRPELMADKWQNNPFGKGKLYHSGDLARYTSDGQIEFLGRIDKQVKVNGYRIELDEIENAILAIRGISDCVVTVSHFDTHDILNAYYVGEQQVEQDLKQYLNDHLPKYMIPKTITHIDCMPLTTNDKVDTTRLPNPSPIQQSNKVYSEPSNEIEQTFVDVFGEVLKQNDVGVDDDFFELGGNSLEAMLVVSHLKRFGHHISMQTLYQYKTVRQIVNYMYQNQQSLVALPDNLSELQKIVMSRYNLGILEDSLSHRPLGNTLLTGVTGFLGAYLIEALQGYSHRIYCFIRADNEEIAWYKLMTNLNDYFSEETVEMMLSNIEVIVGDFECMDDVVLPENMDTIIHAGARTDHFGDDDEFEKVNVQGTVDAIRLAQQHHARLIYVSTISVGTYFDIDTEDVTFSEADVYKGQLLTSPYTRSKFYSELKVLEAVNNGLDGRIVRVGNLTSPYNGRWHMRNIKTNRFSMVMNDLLQLDCIGVSLAEMPVDFSFVDTTARQIVALAQVNTPQIIYHVLSPNKMPVKSLLECVKRKEIELVSDESFNEILQKQDMYETIGLTSVDREQQLAMIDTTLTLKIMNHISEKWPTITNNWLHHWAQYIKTIFNK
ncbi:TPA: amino acid adenylation domain-containing protein [Staphylococcus aureus]|nr:amino acid adenylation domain-containing protein [Staphylococcus aureus]HDB5952604.1 amino acid adenylation domain-containing protein [Staphylococcus aureus]